MGKPRQRQLRGCTLYTMCREFQAVLCHLLKCQGTGNRGRNKTTERGRGQIIKGLLYQEKAQSTCLDMHMTPEAYGQPSEKVRVDAVSRSPALAQRQTQQAHTKVCCVCVHKRAEMHTSCPLRYAHGWSSPQTACSPRHALGEAILRQQDTSHTQHREAHIHRDRGGHA